MSCSVNPDFSCENYVFIKYVLGGKILLMELPILYFYNLYTLQIDNFKA